MTTNYDETIESKLQERLHYKELYKKKFKQSQKELFGLQFDFDQKNKEHTERYVNLMNTKIRLEKENEKLKKEKEQLEHDLLCHHCEIRWHDPKGNNDRPDKEYIDEYCEEFGYDDETKETLYEAFCIDEDDEDEE